MTCHHGYTSQNAIFVLLNLAVLAWLIASRSAALHLRVVGSACSLVVMVYYSGLAAACESPSFSAMLDSYWPTHSLVRLRVVFNFAMLLSLAFPASHCIIKSSSGLKVVKLLAVTVPVLASTCMVFLICSVNGIEDLFAKFMAVHAVGCAISWLVIFGAMGSRTMTWCMYLSSLLTISGALVHKAYNLDLDGRVMPHTAEDAIHPHWSAPLFFALTSLAQVISHAAALHAVINHSHLPPHLLPSFASSLLKSTGAALTSHYVIPFAASAFVLITIFPSFSTAPSWHGRVRELLTIYTAQEVGSMWWWAMACCVVLAATFLVALQPPPLAPFIELATRRPDADSSQSNKRRRGDQNAVHASKFVNREQGAHAISRAQEYDPSYRPGTSVGQLTLQSTHTEHSNRVDVEKMAGYVQAGMVSETAMFIERAADDVSGPVLTFSVSSNFQKRCGWNTCLVCSPSGQQTSIASNLPVLLQGCVAPELLISGGDIEIAFRFVVAPNSATGARIFSNYFIEHIEACQQQTFAPS